MKIKHIYIKNGDGFGNKVYDLIFAVYLYNLYNDNTEKTEKTENTEKKDRKKCIVNYILLESKHEKPNDPKLYNIFKDAKRKINFLTNEQYQKINKNPNIKIKKLYDYIEELDDLPKYEELDEYTKFNDCFQLVYKMYSTFSEKDKNIFLNFNEDVITDKRVFDYKKIDYTILHIRYGDKLNYTKNNIKANKNINEFLLYTPEYYINAMLKKYTNEFNNKFIIILTDSIEIIKYYLTNIYLKNNYYIIFDSEWFNSFYLFYYAKVIFLSTSTFSFCGAFFNEKATSILLMDHDFLNNKNISKEFNSISDKWIINYDKKYILNYNKSLLLEMSLYNMHIKKNISYIENKKNIKLLKTNIYLPYVYKNSKFIDSNKYIFKLKIKKILNFPKNKLKIKINKFTIELLFNKILIENNVKECNFISRDMFLPKELYIRLNDFSNVKINNIYINENEHDYYQKLGDRYYLFNFDNIYKIINNESLIFFNIKDDYGAEFDFYYDYYMFKINEYLNKVKYLKLCIIFYTPNMILPFTLNTLKNIANYAEKYEIIYTYDGIVIIYHNIKNYNINIAKLENKFNYLYNNIIYLTNEEIMKEIVYAQQNPNSIASTYFIKFNDKISQRDINNMKYVLEIIDLDYNIKNDKFLNILLPLVYIEFNRLNHLSFLYTFENITNEILFTEYYIKVNNSWIMLLDENKKYYDIKQNINDMKTEFKYSIENENKNENKDENKTKTKTNIKTKNNIKTKKKSLKYKKIIKKSKKISKKLSNIINKI